ncbi:uncharacterized protein LOC114170324 [Vigna unguiculata]|uniref:uncharacterized protein LOC114170324 n=1 Tax=Vigna unguiculata TaxID=3917 RepID=UPI00101629CF|nr:uncharacterized protein LOC114170324 [Vigna unguiculata]
MFLGLLLTERGIEANPDKCAAIINMRSPSNVKEVQRLTGRMAALSRFLAKSGDKGFPYFQCLKKNEKFQWTDQCEEAFQKLKEYLSKPPVLCKPEKDADLALYISMTEHAVSSILVQESRGDQRPVYFVSKVLHGAEVRYPTIEKAALAIVVSARRLRHYFQNHRVKVMTDLPIRYILQKPDISSRAQFLADFLVELSEPPVDDRQATKISWILFVDGASNLKGSGAGIVLEGLEGVLIKQSLRFAFKASNNQAEYEALIAGMLLAKEMGITRLLVKSDSTLVAGQVTGEFQACDPQLAKFKSIYVDRWSFVQWIEAEPVAVISGSRVREFIWKNIVFSSMEHPQTNGQAEAANKVILRGVKRRLMAAKGEWPNEIHRVLWAYHTTPQTSTRETPFTLVYGTDAMIPVEISENTRRARTFNEEVSEVGL